MARIPVSSDVPQAPTGALRAPAVRVPQVSSGGLEGIQEAVETVAAFANDQRARESAVDRARKTREFNTFANDELRRVQTEDDLSQSSVAEGYANLLKEKQKEFLEGHTGSSASRAALNEKFEAIRFRLTDQASAESVNAQRALVHDSLRQDLDAIALSASNTPEGIFDDLKAVDATVDNMASALTLNEERDNRELGKRNVLNSAIETMFSKGDLASVDALIKRSGIPELAGSESMLKIKTRLSKAERDRRSGEIEGLKVLERARTILGPDVPITGEMRRVFAGLGDKRVTPRQKIDEINEVLVGAGRPRMTARQEDNILGLEESASTIAVKRVHFDSLLDTIGALEKQKTTDPEAQRTIDNLSPLLTKAAEGLDMTEPELQARIAAARGVIPERQGQSPEGKLIADLEALKTKLGEDDPLVQAIDKRISEVAFGDGRDEARPLTPDERVQFGVPEGVIAAFQPKGTIKITDTRTEQTFTMVPTADESGNITLQFQGGVPAGDGIGKKAGKFAITGGKADEIRSQLTALEGTVDVLGKLQEQVQADPSRFGLGATARKGATFVTGLATELLQLTGLPANLAPTEFLQRLVDLDTQGVDDDALSELRPPTSGEIDVVETILKFRVARALQPEGKLLASTVKAADDITDLQGLTTGELVAQRLTTVQNLLSNSVGNLQRRLQQGVGGTTEIEAPAVTAPVTKEDDVDPIEAALRALEEAAGIGK